MIKKRDDNKGCAQSGVFWLVFVALCAVAVCSACVAAVFLYEGHDYFDGLVGFVGLLSFVVAATALVCCAVFRKSCCAGVVVLFLSVCLLVCFCGYLRKLEGDEVEAMKRGDVIVNALLVYEEESGRYPATLDALIPRYLLAIPRTGRGFTGGEFVFLTSFMGESEIYFDAGLGRRFVNSLNGRGWVETHL